MVAAQSRYGFSKSTGEAEKDYKKNQNGTMYFLNKGPAKDSSDSDSGDVPLFRHTHSFQVGL